MELPRADRGVGGKTRWIAADGHSYHTQKEAIVAQLGLPPEPPEPPRRSSAGSAHWYMDGDVFDTRREAFHAYYKSKTSYVAKLGESLNSFDYPYDDYKETVLSEMTGRGRGESALALRLRGNDMQAAVKWLFDNPDHSHSRTEDMLGYGALSAFILHLYLMITYLGSLASDPAGRRGMELSRPRAPNGFFDWFQDQFVLSYTDPTSGIVRKLLFTAPQSGLMAFGIFLGVLGIYFFMAKRTDLLVFSGGWADIVPAAIGFVFVFAALTSLWGGYGLLANGVSQNSVHSVIWGLPAPGCA